MHKTLPYLALFAVVVLLQVFLFDNLSISIYLNPGIWHTEYPDVAVHPQDR